MPTTATVRRALALAATAVVAGASLAAPAAAKTPHRTAKAAAKHHRAHHRAKRSRCHAARRRHHRVARCARVALVGPRTPPRVDFVNPRTMVDVDRGHRLNCRVRANGARVSHVTFLLDGTQIHKDATAPYTCSVHTDELRRGSHHLQAWAASPSGVGKSRQDFKVTTPPKAQAPASDDQDLTGWDRGDSWSDSFESGDFTKWSWWGQDQQDIWGHTNVVTARSAGVPALGGSHVAKFETTPDDIAHGRIHAKLYRGFGNNLGDMRGTPPSDVSGTYSAWYYFPTTYTVPDHSWASIFQFKEEYRTQGGDKTSDPLWWVQLGPVHWASDMSEGYGDGPITGRSDAPVAFINNFNSDWNVHHSFVPVPLGRWFELKAVLKQNDRIDFYMDGKLLDTAHASDYPVSPFHGGASKTWTFGIGNYSTGANGPLYADRVGYSRG